VRAILDAAGQSPPTCWRRLNRIEDVEGARTRRTSSRRGLRGRYPVRRRRPGNSLTAEAEFAAGHAQALEGGRCSKIIQAAQPQLLALPDADPGAIEAIEKNGDARQKSLLPAAAGLRRMDRHMNLTEPQAGSDLGR